MFQLYFKFILVLLSSFYTIKGLKYTSAIFI